MVYVFAFGIVAIAVTCLIAKLERKNWIIELAKLLSASLLVFISVFAAQTLNNFTQAEKEREHAISLLHATNSQISSFISHLSVIPNAYQEAKSFYGAKYQPIDLFRFNELKIPSIITLTLSDTNVVRVMHPQSSSAIFTELENAKKALEIINTGDIHEAVLNEAIQKAIRFLSSISMSLEYDIRFQNNEITQDELFDFHLEQQEEMKKNPPSPLIKINSRTG